MFKINAQQFKAAASFASKDKSRPNLTTVRVWQDFHGYRLVATDSYRLIGFEHGDVSGEHSYRLSVKAEHASSLKKSDHSLTFGDISDDAKTVEVHIITNKGVERKEYWGVVEGNYPNYQQLLPKVDHSKTFGGFDVNPKYFASACKAIETAYGDSAYISIWSQGHLKPIYFEATDKDSLCFGLVMPINGRFAEQYLTAPKKAAPKENPKVDEPKAEEPKVETPKKSEGSTIAHVEDNGKVTVIAETRKVDLTKKPEAPKPPKAPAKPKAAPKPKATKKAAPKIDTPKVDKPKKQPKPKFESEAVKEFDGKFEGVTFTQKRADACVWATGKTSEHKDALKAAGFRWSRKRQAYFRKAA